MRPSFSQRRLLAVMAVDEPGGAELHLLRLIEGLVPRGWQITLTTPGYGPLADEAPRRGYAWRPLGLGGLGRGAGLPALASWPKVRRLAAVNDVVYLNGGVPGRVLPALGSGGPRRVLHLHDMVSRVPGFWRRADLVLADSRAVAARLHGLSAEVVYGPVDLDPPPAAAPWPTGAGPVVGFLGRIEPRKGPLDLVRAAPLIRAAVPEVRIVIVGEDPYGSDPGYTAAVRSSEAVEHHPWAQNAPGLMRHLDVLVAPSRQEPFGTVLAEAMAVGTPVVATAVDGLPEVVRDGETGRLVAPDDPQALAEAVVAVLADHDRMSSVARAYAGRFAAPAYVDRLETLLTQ